MKLHDFFGMPSKNFRLKHTASYALILALAKVHINMIWHMYLAVGERRSLRIRMSLWGSEQCLCIHCHLLNQITMSKMGGCMMLASSVLGFTLLFSTETNKNILNIYVNYIYLQGKKHCGSHPASWPLHISVQFYRNLAIATLYQLLSDC